MDNSERPGLYTILGLVLGASIMAAGYGLPRLGLSFDAWFGTKPLMDYVLAGGTLLAATVAAIISLSTFRLNITNGYASRFQKGIELLAEPATVASNGGLEMLRDVVRIRPQEYMSPVLRSLVHYISDRHPETWENIRSGSKIIATDEPVSQTTLRALDALADIPQWQREKYARSDRVTLFRPVISQVEFRRSIFTKLDMLSGAITSAKFTRCTFIDCEFGLMITRRLQFHNCVFVRTKFTRKDESKNKGPIIISGLSEFASLEIDGDEIVTNGTY